MNCRNKAAPYATAEKRRQPLPMRRIRIHRRHQHHPPQVQSRIPAQAFRSRHHRHRAAARCPQQIERRNPQALNEPKQTLRGPTHRMINSRRTIGESRAHHVRRVDRSIGRQRRHGVSPGKRISHQPMQQNQRRPRTRAQITHARSIEIHPAFFHARAQRAGASAVETSELDSTMANSSNSQDNSLPTTRFYLSDNASVRFTRGASAPRFLKPVVSG